MKDYQKTLKVGGQLISLERPIIMGILNVTPDSFYDGGKYQSANNALERVGKMLEEGAQIIDIGANSSRPGSIPIPAEEELERLLPVVGALTKSHKNLIISVDTFRAEVAERCLDYGVGIINDISAGDDDHAMLDVIGKYKATYIAMHKKGTTSTMQVNPEYDDVLLEVVEYFKIKKIQFQEAGINEWVLDPGFGFGKSVENNYSLLSNLAVFYELFNVPVLAGLSRKSMINKVLGISSRDALNGTTALNMVALMNGGSILRVHDVKEAYETIQLFNKVIEASRS